MNRPVWLKNNPNLIRNLGFTVNRSLLVVLMLGISSSTVVGSVIASGLAINTGLRKGHSGWVLTIVQSSLVWPVYQLFAFKTSATSHLSGGVTTLVLLTLGWGMLGVLINHFIQKRIANLPPV